MKKLILTLLFTVLAFSSPSYADKEKIFYCGIDKEEKLTKKFFYETDGSGTSIINIKNPYDNTVRFKKEFNGKATIEITPFSRQKLSCEKSTMRGEVGGAGSYVCYSEIFWFPPPILGYSTRGLKTFTSTVYFSPKEKSLTIIIREELIQVKNSWYQKSIRVKNDYNTTQYYRAQCNSR